MIHLTEVRLDEEAERLVLRVLRSGRLAQGPMVEQFEHDFAQIVGSKHAIAMNSGTTALIAAMQSLNLRPGDEVITTPFTFVATLNAILEAGGVAHLVDINPEDYTISPEAVQHALTERTRVVLPVHLYGYPADMPAIDDVLARTGTVVLEDAAQAHGSRIANRPVGTWGLAVFSFYATKNVTTGEGGVVTTNSDEWADTMRMLRNQGMRHRYEYEMPGHNFRMTEMQAAVGISQLRHLQQWTDQRRANAEMLIERLKGIEGLSVPYETSGRMHVFHQFTVRLDRAMGLNRDGIGAEMASRGIETGIYYPRLCHDYECFRKLPSIQWDALDHARRATTEVLSIPVHQWLSESEIDLIASVLRESVRHSINHSYSDRRRC